MQHKEEFPPFAELPNLIHWSEGSSFGAHFETVVYLFKYFFFFFKSPSAEGVCHDFLNSK